MASKIIGLEALEHFKGKVDTDYAKKTDLDSYASKTSLNSYALKTDLNSYATTESLDTTDEDVAALNTTVTDHETRITNLNNNKVSTGDFSDYTTYAENRYATKTELAESTLFTLVERPTASRNSGIDLSSYMSSYNELMIIVRVVPSASTTIGIANTSTGNSGFICSTAKSSTTYIKIMGNKTSEGNWAWDVGGSFGWSTSSSYKYLKNYTTGSTLTMSVVVHGR